MRPTDGSLPSKSWFGTGDIEAPVRPDSTPRDIDAMPEGGLAPSESWADFRQRWEQASKDKRERLALAFANGAVRTPGEVKYWAKELGCTEQNIKRWKTDRTMAKHVGELLRIRALHATAETLESQIERAKQTGQDWKLLAQVGEILGTGVVNVQNNAFVDQRNGGDDEGDKQFFNRFQEKQQKRFSVVEGTRVDEDTADKG